MSSTDLLMNNVDKKDIDQKSEENNSKLNNSKLSNSKVINKPELKRRNAIANFELLDSYQEFIKIYNYKEKEK
jgi:hypothetical protein